MRIGAARRYTGPTPTVTYALDAAAINAQTAVLNNFKVRRLRCHVALRRIPTYPLNVCSCVAYWHAAYIQSVAGCGRITYEQPVPGSVIVCAGARCC